MVKRYYWDRVYEIRKKHWALCDTESAKEGRVSDHNLVLHSSSPTSVDGNPLSEQELPKRIVDLLNGDEVRKKKAAAVVAAWDTWSAADGWDNNEWDEFTAAIESLLKEFGLERK